MIDINNIIKQKDIKVIKNIYVYIYIYIYIFIFLNIFEVHVPVLVAQSSIVLNLTTTSRDKSPDKTATPTSTVPSSSFTVYDVRSNPIVTADEEIERKYNSNLKLLN